MGRCRGALVGLEVMGVKILWEGGFVTLFFFFFVLSLSLVAARCCSSCLARGGGALMFLENKPPPPMRHVRDLHTSRRKAVPAP